MVKTIGEILEGPEISNWTGSEKTKSIVSEEIRKRYGEAELSNFDPLRTALTFRNWLQLGFVPRKGEKAIKSFVVLEVKDKNGKVKKVSRKINLFYYRQVIELKPQKIV